MDESRVNCEDDDVGVMVQEVNTHDEVLPHLSHSQVIAGISLRSGVYISHLLEGLDPIGIRITFAYLCTLAPLWWIEKHPSKAIKGLCQFPLSSELDILTFQISELISPSKKLQKFKKQMKCLNGQIYTPVSMVLVASHSPTLAFREEAE